MALSYDDDPSGLLYPGSMPAGYQLPVSSFDDAAQEELFRQAMAPQPIMPADPVPYPEPEPLPIDMFAAATTLGPKGRGTPPPSNTLGIGLRPLGDRVVVRPKPQRIGETGEEPAQEIAASGALDDSGITPGGDDAIEIDQPGIEAGGVTPEGDAGIEIDQPGIDASGITPEGDAGIEIDALPGEALPPPPTSTTVPNYNALIALASAQPGQADPDRIAHAQRLLGWIDDSGQTAAAPELPDEYRTQQELDTKVAGESAHDNFLREQKREQDRIAEEKRQRDEAQANTIRERDRAIAVVDKARADARRDRDRNTMQARELANQKIDPDRWWHTRGTGQKLAALLGAIAGGLVEARGGRNNALPMIQAMIGEDIDAQKADVANKRAALGEESRSIGERLADAETDHREGELRRQANYQIVRDQITEHMQQWDPRGSQAQKWRGLQQALDRDAAAAADKAEKDATDLKIKIGGYDLKVESAQLARDRFNEAKRIAAAKLAAAGAAGVKQKPAYWFNYQGGAAAGAKMPLEDMTKKEFDDWIKTQKSVKDLNKVEGRTEAQQRKDEADAAKAEAEAQAAKTGYAVNNPESGTALVMKNGQPFVIMDDARRTKVQNIADAAVNIRKLADKIVEVRKRTGGASKYLSPDDYKELQSLATAVDFETFVGFGLGAPSEGDKQLAEAIKGGDMTSWISDPKKGLETYASSVESKANTHFKGSGYDGPYVRFHRAADLAKSKESFVDEIGRRLTTSLSATPKKTGNPLADAQQEISAAITAKQTKQTSEDLQTLAAQAEFAPDLKERAAARAYLQGLTESAVNPEVRARITKILDELPGGDERTGAAR